MSTLLKGVDRARRQLAVKEAELREARQALKSGGSVGGSGSTDQQLAAAEMELAQVCGREYRYPSVGIVCRLDKSGSIKVVTT